MTERQIALAVCGCVLVIWAVCVVASIVKRRKNK